MSHIDVIFIYCPIVTAVSAPDEVNMHKQSAAAIYFHAKKPLSFISYSLFFILLFRTIIIKLDDNYKQVRDVLMVNGAGIS
ncbi:MAG: hypothetical protein AB4080_11160 [Trichodesmium sp.]